MRPSDIERALQQDFAGNADLTRMQRLAWMHPFLDGNGRVARLHTHLLLQAWGLTHGLWSPLRGFARTDAKYKALLQAADEHRQGDLDGRGNLTQAGLGERVATSLISALLQRGFLATDSSYGSLRFAIPRHALRFYFPALWPGAEQDQALLEGEVAPGNTPRRVSRRGPAH